MGGTGRTGGLGGGQQFGRGFQVGVHGSRQSQNLKTSGTSGAQHGQGGSRPGGRISGNTGMVINPLYFGIEVSLRKRVVPCHCMRVAGGGCYLFSPCSLFSLSSLA